MKNWKTSIGTIITAISLVPAAIAQLGLSEVPNWLKITGSVCAFVSFMYMGLNAKDHNVDVNEK